VQKYATTAPHRPRMNHAFIVRNNRAKKTVDFTKTDINPTSKTPRWLLTHSYLD